MNKAVTILLFSMSFFFVAGGIAQLLPNGEAQPYDLVPTKLSNGNNGWYYESQTLYSDDYKNYLLNNNPEIFKIEDIGFYSVIWFSDKTGEGWTNNHQLAYEKVLASEDNIIFEGNKDFVEPTDDKCFLEPEIPECKEKCLDNPLLEWCK